MKRLIFQTLVEETDKFIRTEGGIGLNYEQNDYKITELGSLLVEYGICY